MRPVQGRTVTDFCKTSTKRRYPSVRAAKVNAKMLAQDLLRRKMLVEDLYAYECRSCSGWHLTRMDAYDGKPHVNVFIAAPVEMQRWAMGER